MGHLPMPKWSKQPMEIERVLRDIETGQANEAPEEVYDV
jgi:hypothetical protein